MKKITRFQIELQVQRYGKKVLKGTVSQAGLGFWWHKCIDLGQNERRAWFFLFIFLDVSPNLQSHLHISSGQCQFALA
jgi:hypothetical protein